MPIEMRSFVRSVLTESQQDEVERVSVLAEQLRGHLQDRATAINQAHVVGAQSSVIQHLFLIVPNSNWTRLGAPREKPFPRVCNRIGAFFGHQRRKVDVLSTHVYGYGPLDIKAAVELRPDEGS